jgi:RNA polymerase sigma-70 factor (ECF subfamily)
MNVTVEPTDSELVGQIATGNREAYAAVFRRHQATVYRFSRQMLGSKDAAEDVTQDVFIALAQGASKFDPNVASLTTYLYGIARNLIRQRHKRSRTRLEVDIESVGSDDSTPLATNGNPADELARAQMIQQLRLAIVRLPLRYREAIVLCELNGLSYEDAAAAIRCPIGTVRSRLSRARQMLIAKCRTSMMSEDQRATSKAREAGHERKWLILTKNNC